MSESDQCHLVVSSKAFFNPIPNDIFGISGKCVYQAESSHSILSDVSTLDNGVNIPQYIKQFFPHRHTNARPFIFMTHTRRLFWITTGWFSSLLDH